MDDQCCLIFHALSDKTRVRILELLGKSEKCVSDICQAFDITQPSVSHHLDILKRAGLVEADKRGREVYYSFDRDALYECCGKQFRVFDIVMKKK